MSKLRLRGRHKNCSSDNSQEHTAEFENETNETQPRIPHLFCNDVPEEKPQVSSQYAEKSSQEKDGTISKYFRSKNEDLEESGSDFVVKTTVKNIQGKKLETKKRPAKKPQRLKNQPRINKAMQARNQSLQKFTSEFEEVCTTGGLDVNPDHLQLAIALSKSIMDQQGRSAQSETNFEETKSTNADSSQFNSEDDKVKRIRNTLDEFGFKIRVGPITLKADAVRNRIRENKRSKSVLLTCSKEERERKINEKVTQILTERCTHIENEKIKFDIESIDLDAICRKDFLTYSKAGWGYHKMIDETDVFYVLNLVTPTSAKVGCLLKDWSSIPGREKTPEKKCITKDFKESLLYKNHFNTLLSATCFDINEFFKKHPDVLECRLNVESPEIEKNINLDEFCQELQSVDNTIDLFEGERHSPDMFDDVEETTEGISGLVEKNSKVVEILTSLSSEELPDVFISKSQAKKNSFENTIKECIVEDENTVKEKSVESCKDVLNKSERNESKTDEDSIINLSIVEASMMNKNESRNHSSNVSNSSNLYKRDESKYGIIHFESFNDSFINESLLISDDENDQDGFCKEVKSANDLSMHESSNHEKNESLSISDNENNQGGFCKDVKSMHNLSVSDHESFLNEKNECLEYNSSFVVSNDENDVKSQKHPSKSNTNDELQSYSFDLTQSSEGSVENACLNDASNNKECEKSNSEKPGNTNVNIYSADDDVDHSLFENKNYSKSEKNKDEISSKTSSENPLEASLERKISENELLQKDTSIIRAADDVKENKFKSNNISIDLTQNSYESFDSNALPIFHKISADSVQKMTSYDESSKSFSSVNKNDKNKSKNTDGLERCDEIEYDDGDFERCDDIERCDAKSSYTKLEICNEIENNDEKSYESDAFVVSDDEFNYSMKVINCNERETLMNEKKENAGDTEQKRIASFNLYGSSLFEMNSATNSILSKLECDENQMHSSGIKNTTMGIDDCKAVGDVKNDFTMQTPQGDRYILNIDNVTPVQDYNAMNTPQMIDELSKFGVKPLKRKRAVKLLEHIYQQTHPLKDDLIVKRKRQKIKDGNEINANQCKDEINIQKNNENPVPSCSSSNTESCYSSRVEKSDDKLQREEDKLGADCRDVYAQDCDQIIIKEIYCEPELWIFQKKERRKILGCNVPLHVAFHNYVSVRRKLQDAILKYEPVNIDTIHKGLARDGLRYDPKDLFQFMDTKCITIKTEDKSRNQAYRKGNTKKA